MPKSKAPIGKWVLITWVDSASPAATWLKMSAAVDYAPCIIMTTGKLIAEDSLEGPNGDVAYYTIVGSIDDSFDPSVAQVLIIPKVAVLEMEPLRSGAGTIA